MPSDESESSLREVIRQARERIGQVFKKDITPNRSGVEKLEQIAVTIWQEGWDPAGSDLDLFARDFGALLTASMHSEAGGTLMFRSPTDLSHASLWWTSLRFEVFPFHKAAKRFSQQEGESLLYLFDSVRLRVKGAVGTSA